MGGSHSGDKALGQTLYFCSLTSDCCPGLETLFPYLSLGIRLFSVVPLTTLDLFNALYSVCQRRDDSEQDGVITDSGGTTHSLSCLSSPFSGLIKFATLIQSHLLSFFPAVVTTCPAPSC